MSDFDFPTISGIISSDTKRIDRVGATRIFALLEQTYKLWTKPRGATDALFVSEMGVSSAGLFNFINQPTNKKRPAAYRALWANSTTYPGGTL